MEVGEKKRRSSLTEDGIPKNDDDARRPSMLKGRLLRRRSQDVSSGGSVRKFTAMSEPVTPQISCVQILLLYLAVWIFSEEHLGARNFGWWGSQIRPCIYLV